jgi:hypothetical protein
MKRFNESQERLDYHAGLITSMIANVNRDPKKNPTPYQPEDYMPGKKKKQLPVPMDIDHMIIMNAAMGGTMVELRDG